MRANPYKVAARCVNQVVLIAVAPTLCLMKWRSIWKKWVLYIIAIHHYGQEPMVRSSGLETHSLLKAIRVFQTERKAYSVFTGPPID